tara:strand:- start:5741 stop:6403 length:663 start_codon:yes stop_codon:yes gene_type:complete
MTKPDTQHHGIPVKRFRERRSHRTVAKRARCNRGLRDHELAALATMQWFLARVPSQKEFVAEQILDDAGLIVFVPEETRFRRACGKAKRKREIRVALIPGYLMVAFPAGPVQWGNLLRFQLVRGLVGHEGVPLHVPFGEVKRMLERHSAGEFRAPNVQQWMRTYREFEVGDQVEVLEGLYEGHVAEVTGLRGQNAMMVLNMFGGEIKAEIPMQALGRTAA